MSSVLPSTRFWRFQVSTCFIIICSPSITAARSRIGAAVCAIQFVFCFYRISLIQSDPLRLPFHLEFQPIEFLFLEYANDRYAIQRDARSIVLFSGYVQTYYSQYFLRLIIFRNGHSMRVY